MLLPLVLLFIAVPIAELAVIIQVGQAIGVWWTIGLLIADSLLGSWLMRHQGRATHPGQQQTREEGTGEGNAQGQLDQRADAARELTHEALPSDAGITSTEKAAPHNPPRRP